jgi:adenylate cyclase
MKDINRGLAMRDTSFGADELRVATTTVMFLDVVESVKHVLADATRGSAQIRDLISAAGELAVTRYAGQVVEKRGDGLLLIFSAVQDAIDFGLAVQASNVCDQNAKFEDEVRFRAAIHYGEVQQDAQSIYGASTNLAARISGIAQPGEVLISEAAIDQVNTHTSCRFEDMGYCYLKHFTEPQRIFRALRSSVNERAQLVDPGECAANPTIAVLPFDLNETVASHASIGALVAESVIHYISKTDKLNVIAWLSVKSIKQSHALGDLVAALRCDYVVRGSVTMVGNRLIAHATICRCRDNENFATLRTAGDVADLLQSESELARQISDTIVSSIFEHSVERVSKHRLPSLPSYELMLGAIGLMHNSTRDRFERGFEAFEHLLDRHPRMHVVRPWVAKWYVLKTTRGIAQDRVHDALAAIEQTNRTLDAKPDDSFALAVRGFVHCHLLKKPDAGVIDIEQALRINPNDALAHLYGATVLGAVGKYDAAWQSAVRAIALSPLDPQRYYYLSLAASAAFFAGETDRAESLARDSLKLNTLHSSTYRTLTLALVRQGRIDEARDVCARLQTLEPHLSITTYLQTSIQPEPVRRELARLYEDAGLKKS